LNLSDSHKKIVLQMFDFYKTIYILLKLDYGVSDAASALRCAAVCAYLW